MGYQAFMNCSNLANVVFGNGLTNVGETAFKNCVSLTNVTVPSNVRSIGLEAFAACSNLTNVFLSEGVGELGSRAFSGCTSLKSVMIPSSITNIGYRAFSDCISVEGYAVAQGNPNYSSEDGVLFSKDKSSLLVFPKPKSGSYSIPSSVTNILGYAFDNCDGLTNVTLGQGIKQIGERAFRGCSSLTSLVIPATVEVVGNRAFDLSPNLKSILFLGNAPTAGAAGLGTLAQIFYMPNAAGWGPTFGGSTAQPFAPVANSPTLSVSTGFGFSWTGAGSIPMNVERSTNLDAAWTVVARSNSTGTFTDGTPPVPSAFYRAVLP
jgi:hypothetical protein